MTDAPDDPISAAYAFLHGAYEATLADIETARARLQRISTAIAALKPLIDGHVSPTSYEYPAIKVSGTLVDFVGPDFDLMPVVVPETSVDDPVPVMTGPLVAQEAKEAQEVGPHALDYDCPTCKVPAGDPCLRGGVPQTAAHPVREALVG